MKYTFATVTYDDVSIDFKKIYDYVKKDYESDGETLKDKWEIFNYFGDNIQYFLEKIFNYKVDEVFDNIKEFNDGVLDSIWSDFGDWIEKQDFE